MSNPWWKRKHKGKPRDSWSDIFDELDRFEDAMDEIMWRTFKATSRRRRRKAFYGFSVSTGPDGKPIIHEFGNFPTRHHLRDEENRIEPLIDVLRIGEDIIVVAGFLNAKKNEIKLHVEDYSLIISVNNSRHPYYKELRLPSRVDPNSLRSSYKNGVLEVRLKRIST